MATCRHCKSEVTSLVVEVIQRTYGEYDIEQDTLDLDSGYPFNREEETVYSCPECSTKAHSPEKLIIGEE